MERGKEEMGEVGGRGAPPFLGGLQGGRFNWCFPKGLSAHVSHNAPLLEMREDEHGNSPRLPQPSSPKLSWWAFSLSSLPRPLKG